jgi:endoglucanase
MLLTLLLATAFWDTPQTGANFFNEVETRERFRAAKAAGIDLVRLAPDKWKGASRDYLLGNADDYRGIPPEDLAKLRAILDDAHAEGVSVVLTMLSLPGCRWKQNNGDKNDFRLWRDAKYLEQSARFWRDVATALKGHPAIVAYNILNEPRPERDRQKHVVDVNALYARIIPAIRAVDGDVFIVVDGSDDASPQGLAKLSRIEDQRVIYAFHFYEPWEYIDHRNKDASKWPAHDRATLDALMNPVREWQKKNAVSSTRIWLSEFGVPRTKTGAKEWLADVVDIARKEQWHWSFYSFREDTWDAMDYELGDKPLGAAYWDAIERGEKDPPKTRAMNPIWKVLSDAL